MKQNGYNFILKDVFSTDISSNLLMSVGAIGLYIETFLADGTAEKSFLHKRF